MGLPVYVYRDSALGDCTNGGVSSKFTRLVVMNVEGPFSPTDDTAPVLLERNAGNSVRIVPAKLDAAGDWVPLKPENTAGPMMGGNYAATSDSRFGQAIRKILGHDFYGAVAIHDRFETWEQYDRLSR
jgi:hypothetical protein